jgi:hypothetical protein
MGIKSHREGQTSPLKTNPKAEACYKAGFSIIALGMNTKVFKRLEQECEKARSHLAIVEGVGMYD